MENYGNFTGDNHDTVHYQVSDDGATIYYAEQMKHDHPSWDDWCSGTAAIDVKAERVTGEDVTIDPDHAPDVAALDAANRALDSYHATRDDMRNMYLPELPEVAALVSERSGVRVYGVTHNGYETTVTDDLDGSDYLCFTARGSDYHGRELAAASNGYRWSVYACNVDRLNEWISGGWGDHTDFPYRDESVEDCHGYTFQNIERNGDSFPAKGELLDTI